MLDAAMGQDGYVAPMTATADGEIIDGSARHEVAGVRFGDNAIVVPHDGTRPVIMVRTDIPSADDPRAKRIAVAANRIGQVDLDFDPAILAELSREIDLSPLWTTKELREVTATIDEIPQEDAGPQIDKAEELRRKWETAEGQVWSLGRHKIACLNCTDPEAIKKIMAGEVASFVWADPPYGISIVATNGFVGGGEAYDIPFGGVKKKGNVGGGEGIKASPGLYPIQMRAKGLGSVGGAKPFGSVGGARSQGDQSQVFDGVKSSGKIVDVGKYAPVIGDETTQTAEKASQLFLSLFPKACHVWWGANYYAHVLPSSSCWIVWDKENTGNFADAELAWCSDKSAVRIFRHMWNGLMKASERGVRRVHPTQKPVALASWAFEKYGENNDVIVDPFLGSGISLIAAEQAGDRKVIGLELSPDYIAVCLERWSILTGQHPTLL